MWWSRSTDADAGPHPARRASPCRLHASPLGITVVVILIGTVAYGAAITLPAWETDTWVLDLLAQRTLHASSWPDALAVSRFVIDNPKGWSDAFILASWFVIYRFVGANVVAFHVVGIACHLVTAVLLAWLSLRSSRSPRVALWTGVVFAVLPLSQDVVAVEAHSQYPIFGALFLGAWLLLDRWQDRASRSALAGAVFLYLLALATKELAFALPALLAVEIASSRSGRDTDPRVLARAWTGLALATAVALPFLARPFWVALASPERATAPADAAMLRDLAHYLVPSVLVPKMGLDVARWAVTPFAAEGIALGWFPINATISVAAFGCGLGALLRDRPLPRWRWLRPSLWILLGYLPVGFQLERSSFEKTGELYLAAMGIAMAWGELLGSGITLRRTRSVLGGALVVAMIVHLQLLHHAMRVHGERVQAAVRELGRELDSAPPAGGIVIVGEERLDRGAIDAVALQIAHDRGGLGAPLAWLGGGGVRQEVAQCPDGAWLVDVRHTRLIGWNDEVQRFERLDDPAKLARALAWRNPDPERVWLRDACLLTPKRRTLLTTEVLEDLSPDTILRRL